MARRQRRAARPNPKPYGFCCTPYDEILPRDGLNTSLISIRCHECPALKIREQEIIKRPLGDRGLDGDGTDLPQKLSFQSQSVGGMKLSDATESMIELMIDAMRAQRQAEYEAKMDRLAEIGERKTKEQKLKRMKCGPPCWYTDYSPAQLQHLKDLEDAMFKDKKENTVNRTANCLASIGMTTDFVTVDSQILRKLVNDYSTDIKTFICEIYKAIRGNYFEEEGLRLDYTTHERIMISGVVYLELPQVILELHKRLPAIIKFKFPEKPKAPKLIIAKKMISPLLETLYPAVNWKLYATQLFKWREDCLAIPRPVAILPKETKEVTIDDDEDNEVEDNDEQQKLNDEKNKQLASVTRKSNEKDKTSDRDKQSDKNSAIGEDNRDDTPLFTVENPWTEPPEKPCPMKYIKLLRQTGPLKTDDEFFTKLNRPPCKNQVSPSFRLQSVLLDAEADLYGLMHEANELTSEVTRLAKEILEPDTGCDACCSCRETRRTHLMYHATKAPHAVVDGVTVDENDNPQVIGATVMHSPADSIASTSQPVIVPSTEKLVKNKIISGAVTLVDGEPVRQIAGVTKAMEHISREELLAEMVIKERKNVPRCGCRDEKKNQELEQQVLSTKKDEGLCYGKKFRPEEGPAYDCDDFGKKDEHDDCGCGEEFDRCQDEEECPCNDDLDECFNDDFCGCGDNFNKCADKDVIVRSSKIKQVVCKRCGREINPKCIEANAKKRQANKGKKITNKCSCDSLSEFLQMDLRKTTCVMPKKIYHKSGDASKKSKKTTTGKNRKSGKGAGKDKIPRMKIVKLNRVKKVSQIVLKQNEENEEEAKESSDSVEESVDEGGPYGLRTKSEEALPVERTLAYLTDLHPPIRPAEQIPVRKGGRPCRCRENRNNRKQLLYGIGALVNEKNEANSTRLIDGLTWITPEPSIRGSDEYILEYELADSPYEKQICGATRKAAKDGRGCCGQTRGENENSEENRERDWENAFKDEYLTEFFTKDRDGTPCWTKCAKYKKPDTALRKLKAMKPVCECKYERRIVKRNEERKNWHDRQEKLKSFDKEAFLHIDDMAKTELSDSDEKRDVTVISAVVMQTPCDTPPEGRSRSHLPYPIQKIEIVNKNEESKNVADSQEVEESKIENESSLLGSYKSDEESTKEVGDTQQKGENIDEMNVEKDEIKEVVFTGQMSKCKSFFEQAERELTDIMQVELEKISVENDFVSLKLPNYHKLAQLSYWISYRVRGMCFTDKFKKDLWLETMKTWNSKRLINKTSFESLRVKKEDRCKLNFDHAKYWKRKIGKLNRNFYAKTRQESIEIGREMWQTMEFGKFPHLLFKQAYFTYLPPREVDVYAFRTYLMK